MTQDAFTQAHQLHLAGALPQAIEGYRRWLEQEPEHRLALIYCGIAHGQNNEFEASLSYFRMACRLDPCDIEAQYNLACSLQRLHRFQEARLVMDELCIRSPDRIEHHQTRALVLLQCNAIDEAIAALQEALTIDPKHESCCHRLISLLLHQAKPLEAIKALANFEDASEQSYLPPEILLLKARTLWLLERYQEAIDSAILLAQEKAHRVDALSWIAAAYLERGDTERAISACDEVLERQPKHHAAVNTKIAALNRERRWAEVLVDRESLMRDHADEPHILLNLSTAMMYTGESESALNLLESLIQKHPSYRLAWSNKVGCLLQLGRFAQASKLIEGAKQMFPDDVDIAYLDATEQLALRRDADVWALTETRFTNKQSAVKLSRRIQTTEVPRWTGAESLAGKRIIVAHEQGLGDAIQFARFCDLLAARGACVIVEAPQSLAALLAQRPSINQIVSDNETEAAFDYWIPMMSIPAALQLQPDQWLGEHAYLRADPAKSARWASRLGCKQKPRVGLAWRGNIDHPNDYWRSIRLSTLLPHLSPDCEWISLQIENRKEDQAEWPRDTIKHYADDLVDFSETAALIDQLDLVICVDTSVAHLSAAMGKPTWLLVALAADWRWGRSGETSAWYRSLRLFRQDKFMDWTSCLERLSAAIKHQFPKNSISIDERSRIRASGKVAT